MDKQTQELCQRYLEACYGEDVWYKAPELFSGPYRVIWYIANDRSNEMLEEHVKLAESVRSRVREVDDDV